MAETAGLVLGGIALVGLVSTCVEISEYLESAKNRTGEFKMALTKVNLIKQRLCDWSAAIPDGMPPCPQSDHTMAPTECGVLIEETLSRMKQLLDKTSRMSRRHCPLSPSRQCDLNAHSGGRLPSEKSPFRSQSVVSDISLPSDSGASSRTSHPRRPQFLLSFSLKVLWVFQDKKRFEDVIVQLDFLLTNLEKISETLQGRYQMSQRNSSDQRPAFQNWKNEPGKGFQHQLTAGDAMLVDHDDGNKLPWTQKFMVASISQSTSGALQLHPNNNRTGSPNMSAVARGKQPQSEYKGLPSPLKGTGHGGKGRPVSGDSIVHRFQDNESHDYSDHLLGDIGITPESTHKGHDFVNNHSHNESMMLSGSLNLEQVGKLLREKRADRRKDKADERKATTAKSSGGIQKRPNIQKRPK